MTNIKMKNISLVLRDNLLEAVALFKEKVGEDGELTFTEDNNPFVLFETRHENTVDLKVLKCRLSKSKKCFDLLVTFPYLEEDEDEASGEWINETYTVGYTSNNVYEAVYEQLK